jgi:hypothetical protein
MKKEEDTVSTIVSQSGDEFLRGEEMVLRVLGDDGTEEKTSRSLLHELYSEEDIAGGACASRHLRCNKIKSNV